MAHKICSPAVMKSKNKQLIKSINKKNVHLKGSEEEGCAIPMVRYLQFLRMSLDHKHYQPMLLSWSKASNENSSEWAALDFSQAHNYFINSAY